MAYALTQKEISARLLHLRNLERLHASAKQYIKRLTRKNKKQRERIGLLEATLEKQKGLIEKLFLRIEELERMVFGRRKKKNGGEKGENPSKEQINKQPDKRPSSSYSRPLPQSIEVTKEKHHSFDACPSCGDRLEKKHALVFYQEDIILPSSQHSLKEVSKETIEKGWCPRCHAWRFAIPPPGARVMLGPRVRAFVSYASVILRLSYSDIQTLLADMYNLAISKGEIESILDKEAKNLRPDYEEMKERIQNQKGVHYDETVWNVQEAGEKRYGWVMTGVETPETVFLLGESRGKGIAEELKGKGTHIGISDDYGAYRNLFSLHQLCWAHPLRKLRDLAHSSSLAKETSEHCKQTYEQFSLLYQNLRDALVKPFDFEERKAMYPSLSHAFDEVASLNPLDPQKLATIKASLRERKECYFVCLFHKDIPPDNNKAERAARHIVIKRKISFGSRSQQGAKTLSVLASILLSLKWKKPEHFFEEYLALRAAYA